MNLLAVRTVFMLACLPGCVIALALLWLLLLLILIFRNPGCLVMSGVRLRFAFEESMTPSPALPASTASTVV
jgi:hypothetical protein